METENALASDSSEESDMPDDEEQIQLPLTAPTSKIHESPTETLQVTAFHPSLG